MNIPRDRKITFFVTFGVALLIAALTRWDFLGDFLLYDDTIYLPKAIYNHPTVAGLNQYRVIDAVSVFRSVVVLKCIPLFISAINSALIASIFLVYVRTMRTEWAILLGLLIGSVPIAPDQIIFVTGSHPTFSLFFILLAMFIYGQALHASSRKFLYYITLTTLVLLLASTFAAVSTLGVIAMSAWIVATWVVCYKEKSDFSQYGLALGISILSVTAYFLYVYKDYHYTGLVGWVDISLSQIIQNLIISVGRVGVLYGDVHSLPFSIFVLIAVIGSGAAIMQWKIDGRSSVQFSQNIPDRPKNLLILGVISIIASALTFGPSAVTTSMLDRYLIAPFVLATLSLVAFALYYFGRSFTGGRQTVFRAVILILLALNIYTTHVRTHERFDSFLITHLKVKQFVSYEGKIWPSNAQVVFLLSKPGYNSPIIGFNHWSTWYFRYLTGNLNILGLLGTVASLGHYPMVEQYRDHADEYWDHTSGRSRRIQMKGIEAARPLFVYLQNSAGEFQVVDHVILGSNGNLRRVDFGMVFNKSGPFSLVHFCGKYPDAEVFDWKNGSIKVCALGKLPVGALGAGERLSELQTHGLDFNQMFDGSRFSEQQFYLVKVEHFLLS